MPFLAKSWILLIAALCCCCCYCEAWLLPSSFSSSSSSVVVQKRRPQSGALRYSIEDNDNKEEEEDSEKRRMEAVRSLQIAFYKSSNNNNNAASTKATPTTTSKEEGQQQQQQRSSSSSSSSEMVSRTTRLDAVTGKLLHLPLWRAPWWEVPGRSNGGSDNLKVGNLFTVDTYNDNDTTNTNTNTTSAVVGCLLHIQDYRRFANGRLLLLVHVLERFVVTNIHQELPYSIVDAQIVPDIEEMDPNNNNQWWCKEEEDDDVSMIRGMAVQESVRYHDYEYDPNHALSGVSNKTYLQATDILWSAIARVLPYCPFSKTMEPPTPPTRPITTTTQDGSFYIPTKAKTKKNDKQKQQKQKQPCLESQLLQKGIFQVPPSLLDPELEHNNNQKYKDLSTVDELEYELWLALNRFLLATKTPVSPVLLGLLPHRRRRKSSSSASNNNHNSTRTTTTTTNNMDMNQEEEEDWPNDFSIYPIVQEFEKASSLNGNTTTTTTTTNNNNHKKNHSYTHDFVRVSINYPAYRRQRRLSYSALHLLETTSDVANSLRPILLQTPSTKQRLRFVLQQFDQWQEDHWGEFQ
eukprot:scaffold7520_cov114-Cylindrotheca_fusiformis.AAC.2